MENKSNIVVLGAGKSGLGASLLAKKNGANVLVSDSSPISNYCKTFFDNSEILWEQNGHSEKEILSADLIIKSPSLVFFLNESLISDEVDLSMNVCGFTLKFFNTF